jgi:hypothetical protein
MTNEFLEAHLDALVTTDADFVDRAFRLVLRRPPDDDARERALS